MLNVDEIGCFSRAAHNQIITCVHGGNDEVCMGRFSRSGAPCCPAVVPNRAVL